MNPAYDFHDRVAVITGAGSGMGLATAQAFAESGAAVVLADRNEQTLRTATAELTSAGRQALDVVCDVSDEEQVAALVDRTVATFGRLDFAFNNAGIQASPTDAADEPAETFDRVNAINLRGVWACMKHELRPMRAQGSGAIVNCSSLAGLVGGPGRLPRLQTRRHRPHQERGPRVRAPRRPHQRDLPRNDRDPDGQGYDRQGRTRCARGRRQSADRPAGARGRDRCSRALALQPGSQLRARCGTSCRWRLHRPLNPDQEEL
jgi:NAD(P)-dependent dehydrogenase (short-subunit alcohol dehydrogenase family)